MEPRGGDKWVRDIKSLAAEFDFYKEYSQAKKESLKEMGYSIPKLYGSFSNFDNTKDNPENLFEKEGKSYKPRDDLIFVLLLEDLGSIEINPQYVQMTDGLSIVEVSDIFKSMATLHADTSLIAQH